MILTPTDIDVLAALLPRPAAHPAIATETGLDPMRVMGTLEHLRRHQLAAITSAAVVGTDGRCRVAPTYRITVDGEDALHRVVAARSRRTLSVVGRDPGAA